MFGQWPFGDVISCVKRLAKINLFSICHEGGQILEQIGCRVFIWGDIWSLTGHSPEQPAQTDAAWARFGLDGLKRSLPTSTILWFPDILKEPDLIWVHQETIVQILPIWKTQVKSSHQRLPFQPIKKRGAYWHPNLWSFFFVSYLHELMIKGPDPSLLSLTSILTAKLNRCLELVLQVDWGESGVKKQKSSSYSYQQS